MSDNNLQKPKLIKFNRDVPRRLGYLWAVKVYGLIGKSLQHSFSATYFAEKWKREGFVGYQYHLLEFSDIGAIKRWKDSRPKIWGLNVTIPYKESIIDLCDELSSTASEIGAVNCIKLQKGKWVGHNTDGPAVKASLEAWMPKGWKGKTFILGQGGASKATAWALQNLGWPYHVVSRRVGAAINYDNLHSYIIGSNILIINTTPVGMFPETEGCLPLPFGQMDKTFYLFDLIYNPEKTLFLSRGESQGCTIKNGYEPFRRQAELSWRIWNT